MGEVVPFPPVHRRRSPVDRFHDLIEPHLQGLPHEARKRVLCAGYDAIRECLHTGRSPVLEAYFAACMAVKEER